LTAWVTAELSCWLSWSGSLRFVSSERRSRLLIVRRIVREHGGELSIESSEGKGLTLTIRLPYAAKRVRMLEAGRSHSLT